MYRDTNAPAASIDSAVASQPAAGQSNTVVASQLAAAEPATIASPQPAAGEPATTYEPEPFADQPATIVGSQLAIAQPQLAAGHPASSVAPHLIADQPATSVASQSANGQPATTAASQAASGQPVATVASQAAADQPATIVATQAAVDEPAPVAVCKAAAGHDRLFARNDLRVACAATTHRPLRCTPGNAHWSMAELKAAVPEFVKLYKQRPIKFNHGGQNVNHNFALWFSVRAVKPKYVIESGVFKGQGTWLLRHAAGPDAKIFSFDPASTSKLEFRDHSGRTQYFMGEKFEDFSMVDWDKLIPEDMREHVFVVLDDHMASVRRVKEMLHHGFVHLWYDDNWANGGDCYSFNLVCSEPVGTNLHYEKNNANGQLNKLVRYRDNFNSINEFIPWEKHEANVDYLQRHLEVYFEFPALWDVCIDHERQYCLFTWAELNELGISSTSPHDHFHLYPPYVRLKLDPY